MISRVAELFRGESSSLKDSLTSTLPSSDALVERARQATDTMRAYVARHPGRTLGAALIAGVLIGCLTKRK